MRYGERKTVLRDARLRTTAAEDAALDRLADMMRRNGITGPYRYILGRDNYTVCGYHNISAEYTAGQWDAILSIHKEREIDSL